MQSVERVRAKRNSFVFKESVENVPNRSLKTPAGNLKTVLVIAYAHVSVAELTERWKSKEDMIELNKISHIDEYVNVKSGYKVKINNETQLH